MSKSVSEHKEQVEVRKWYDSHYDDRLLFSVPNGAFLGGGNKRMVVASKLKNEGMRSGVPDLVLAKPMGKYHGLFIEMKRADGGVLSKAQKRFIGNLRLQGYLVEVCHGAAEAIAVLSHYLRMGE